MIVLFANLLKFVFETYLNCREKYTPSVADKKKFSRPTGSATLISKVFVFVCVCVCVCVCLRVRTWVTFIVDKVHRSKGKTLFTVHARLSKTKLDILKSKK